MNDRLKALSDQPTHQPLVVYVKGPAGVDASGNVYLLGADPIGDHPRNRIALGDILALLQSDRPHKLLVLDLWSPSQVGFSAPPPTLLSAAVARTLPQTAAGVDAGTGTGGRARDGARGARAG